MEVRLAESRDYTELFELFQKNDFLPQNIHQKDFVELCHWLYQTHPSSVFFELVVSQKDQLIGHHGLTPFPLIVHGQKIIAGFASNLLIDSNFRNALVFLGLQKDFFGKYVKSGFHCIFGLVNKSDVLSTHLKTGYKKLFDVPVYAFPVSFPEIVKKLLPKPWSSFLIPFAKLGEWIYRLIFEKSIQSRIEEVDRFDDSIDPVCQSFQKEWTVVSERNKDILNWRFASIHHRSYKLFTLKDEMGKIKAYLVLRKMPMKQFSTMAIVDMVWDPQQKKYAQELLQFALKYARQEKVDLLSVLMSSTEPISSILKRTGFLKTPEKFTLVVSTPKNSQIFQNINYEPSWYISWFDHDFV